MTLLQLQFMRILITLKQARLPPPPPVGPLPLGAALAPVAHGLLPLLLFPLGAALAPVAHGLLLSLLPPLGPLSLDLPADGVVRPLEEAQASAFEPQSSPPPALPPDLDPGAVLGADDLSEAPQSSQSFRAATVAADGAGTPQSSTGC